MTENFNPPDGKGELGALLAVGRHEETDVIFGEDVKSKKFVYLFSEGTCIEVLRDYREETIIALEHTFGDMHDMLFRNYGLHNDEFYTSLGIKTERDYENTPVKELVHGFIKHSYCEIVYQSNNSLVAALI